MILVPKLVDMVFYEDKYIDGILAYRKGEISKVPAASVDRWIRRGGIVVTNAEPETVVVVEDPFAVVESEVESDNLDADDDAEKSDTGNIEAKRSPGRPRKIR